MRTIICLFFLICSTSVFAEEKLIFAVDLIRHGDRTPTNEILRSPHHWVEGLGELTALGKLQEQQLGARLRQLYVKQYQLLPERYQEGTLYVRSTDMTRTINSAKALLSGLYPQTYTKISIHTVPKADDHLLAVKPRRNLFSMAKLYFVNRTAWKDKTAPLQAKLKTWGEIAGLKLTSFQKLGALADNLHIRQLHHVPLPDGIPKEDADNIIALSEWSIVTGFKLPEIYQPMGREFLTTVADYFAQIQHNKTKLKYVLFSGHDSSILAVMSTMGAPLNKNPRYASDLNFSLFEDNNQYYVKINFNQVPVRLALCHNTNVCTLEQFRKLIN